MDELRSRSVLDRVRSEEKSNLCRIIFFTSITLSSEMILKFFGDYAREHFSERVTGLMIVYPNCMIYLIESNESEIFQVCSRFLNVRPKMFHTSKCLPMEMCVEERFFEKWYGRRVTDDFGIEFSTGNELEQIDSEDFEEVMKIYCKMRKNLYDLFNELREARTTGPACLAERLDKLGSPGDSYLPDENTLRALLESSWGESLEKLVDNYWNEICSNEDDDEIWPFPDNQCPLMNAIAN